MSARLKLRLVALGIVVVIGLGLAYQANGAADVAHIDFVGWWSKRPGAMPTKTDTGFEVGSSGVDGTDSVAAFRILINGDIKSATLVLTEESDTASIGISTPKLQLCPTSTPWLKVNDGKYDDAPKPDCSSPIAMTRDATKLTWSADITSLLAGPKSELSLMAVPAPDDSLPVPPTYFITFTTPRIDATGTPDVKEPTPAAAGHGPAVTSAPVASKPSSAPRVTTKAPTAPGPTAAPAAPATSAPAAAPQQQAAAPTPARFGAPANQKASKQWGKLIVLVPLSLLAGAAYTLARRRLIPNAT
jgi:hypothetical protein